MWKLKNIKHNILSTIFIKKKKKEIYTVCIGVQQYTKGPVLKSEPEREMLPVRQCSPHCLSPKAQKRTFYFLNLSLILRLLQDDLISSSIKFKL